MAHKEEEQEKHREDIAELLKLSGVSTVGNDK
jgi:hypothetical protein